ncbi:hypothetical protein MJ904_11495 [Massilia sp. MB5]|uniref:hypothetical protein n=1 Tax=unclassified Massilia TaxID=2609279 RepID=UPI000A539144|nr:MULTISPECIES: hypothetical protein [unclassified Massilia]UMR32726.1 hypothetical protein MJ904_11495 [Massilia sp. MB5]
MFKKLGLFIFACAMGSSYAFADNCEVSCERRMERCEASSTPRAVCHNEYARCIKRCTR